MSKFNSKSTRAVSKPLAQKTGTTTNSAGGTGYLTDVKSELFRLASVNFVGEKTFYESADNRDGRYEKLVSQVAVEDFDWLSKMLIWLRTSGNMRTASLVGAAYAVKARLAAGLHDGNAALIVGVLQRADEPGEFVAFWRAHFGRTLPKPVSKALKKTLTLKFNQYSYLKYDSASRGYRFSDLLRVVRPEPQNERQNALFKYIMAERADKDAVPDEVQMPVLAARKKLMALPVKDRRKLIMSNDAATELSIAGMTWEALAGWLQGPMDAAAWEAVIPNMGYMALMRNLRNFDEAGISRSVRNEIARKLADPDEVAASRQLPFRFMSAYMAAPSDMWRQPLNDALELSMKSVPELKGRTLVLVDTSGSMTGATVSERSTVTAAHVATLFGVVLASKNPELVDLYGFAGGGWSNSGNRVVFEHKVKRGASPLAEVDRFVKRFGEVGHGTMMSAALRQTFDKHNRVVLITDGQCFRDGGAEFNDWGGDPIDVPESTMVYGINAVGYAATAIDPSLRNRHEFAGLTDSVFQQMNVIEAARAGAWPWDIA